MESKQIDLRLAALIRFAIAITVLNIAGHFFLGFEQSYAYPLVALATTYSLELFFEFLFARADHKTPRYKGGFKNLVLFLLPAHISGMAVSMLLFSNEKLAPIIFASAVAILSKIILRVKVNGASRHFMNPSNAGIATTLLLFPWVGIAPPYQFTENVVGIGDWILPVIFICVGSFLNTKFTKRIVLILAWFTAFFLQALIRHFVTGVPLVPMLGPMTGVAYLLFSFYMVSDPATTPSELKNQIAFGASVGFVYGILVSLHVVFGIFFSLLIVCTVRGLYLWIASQMNNPHTASKHLMNGQSHHQKHEAVLTTNSK